MKNKMLTMKVRVLFIFLMAQLYHVSNVYNLALVCTFLHFHCIIRRVICWRGSAIDTYGECHGIFSENHKFHSRPDGFHRDGFYVFPCHDVCLSMFVFGLYYIK